MSSVSIYLLSQCGRQRERDREKESTPIPSLFLIPELARSTFHISPFHTHTHTHNKLIEDGVAKFIASFCGCGETGREGRHAVAEAEACLVCSFDLSASASVAVAVAVALCCQL